MAEMRNVDALLIALRWPAEDLGYVTVHRDERGAYQACAGKAAIISGRGWSELPDSAHIRCIEITREEADALTAAGAERLEDPVDDRDALMEVLEVIDLRTIRVANEGGVWIARARVPLGNTNEQVDRACLITARLAKELGY